jgi:uncharacterized membrane protein
MWSRSELKARAKEVLSGNYWKAFLISLVIAFATGGGGGSSGGGRSYNGGNPGSYWGGYQWDWSFNGNTFSLTGPKPNWLLILGAVSVIMGIVLIAAIGIRIFLGYPLEVGGRKYFVQSAQYFNNKGCFRFAFDGGNYLGIVGTMFLKGIYIFLWTLLLIIPGIIKSYAYRMVPYILADNPNIGARRAIELSNEMTRGHKIDMFILDLSFLGWYLLGLLALFIGALFVHPYKDATEAELYLVLRSNAIESGKCSLWELNLYDPGKVEYNI